MREIRLDAGLNATQLAGLAGWHRTKISKIEYGKQPPTPEDITAWCRHCDASDQTADLIATLRAVESAYVEWRRMQRSGLRRLQDARVPLYERTRHFRVYEPSLIPGLLQTPAYASALLQAIVAFRQVPDDTEAAVTSRMERQRVLYTGDHWFAFLLEEAALRTRIGGPEVMAGQLDRLRAIASLPAVSLGIIPAVQDRAMWPVEGFWIFDNEQVKVELTSASVTVTQPREIAIYVQAFRDLASNAVYGGAARALISAARADLDD